MQQELMMFGKALLQQKTRAEVLSQLLKRVPSNFFKAERSFTLWNYSSETASSPSTRQPSLRAEEEVKFLLSSIPFREEGKLDSSPLTELVF